MAESKARRLETLAVHAGQDVDPTTGAVAQPIYLSTTFERDPDGEFRRGYSYSRSDNPNRRALEACMTALEGGHRALAFSSGLSVATAILRALKAGDHILAPDDVYHGFRSLLAKVFPDSGLETSFIDMTSIETVAASVRPNTRLIWVETPSNPLLKITDLDAIAALARSRGITTVCDGTFATPVLQRPLELGIDMVAHSTTKYIAGHSDVTGGMLIAAKDNALFESAMNFQQIGGAVPSPFDCWLALRGVASLPCRVRMQSESALNIARFLKAHPAVEQVFYPGLESHPRHALAAQQMKQFGGVLSFLVKGSEQDSMRVAAALQIFTRATSLGGAHSLVEHRASIEPQPTSTPRNLLRLAVGLENCDDLIEDLREALGHN